MKKIILLAIASVVSLSVFAGKVNCKKCTKKACTTHCQSHCDKKPCKKAK